MRTTSTALPDSDLIAMLRQVLSVPREDVLRAYSENLAALLPHDAAIMVTGACARAPVKRTGSVELTAGVTAGELSAVRGHIPGYETSWSGTAPMAGKPRSVMAVRSSDVAAGGALLVLVSQSDRRFDPDRTILLEASWEVLTMVLADRGKHTDPRLLARNITAGQARDRAAAEAAVDHAATLSAVLGVLRARSLDDTAARRQAMQLASDALLAERQRETPDLLLTSELATAAFRTLAPSLDLLVRHRNVVLETEGPAVDEPLRQEIAHTARSITTSLTTRLLDDGPVSRIRACWSVHPQHITITVRNDGPGCLHETDLTPLERHAALFRGTVRLESQPGWGTIVTVTLPLDTDEDVVATNDPLSALGKRETQVLEGLASGLRNREIAASLQLSEHTVKFHVRNVLRKLDVPSRGQAAALAHAVGVSGRRAAGARGVRAESKDGPGV